MKRLALALAVLCAGGCTCITEGLDLSSAWDGGADGGAALDCDDPRPGWFFCSDFEADGGWQASSGAAVVTDPGPFDAGTNHVGRLTTAGASLAQTIGPRDTVYARWFQALGPGVDANTAVRAGLMSETRSDVHREELPDGGWFNAMVTWDTSLYTFVAAYYAGMYMQCGATCFSDFFPCPTPGAMCRPEHASDGGAPALPLSGQWHCVELMVRSGTPGQANGELAFWVDDRPMGPFGGLALRSSPQVQVRQLLFHLATDAAGGALFDDVVISTERIGCR